jgi:thiamine biosynthesis protein ThiS
LNLKRKLELITLSLNPEVVIRALRVYVNGESRELSGQISLAELITQLELPAARIAVELNRAVVRRNDWSTTVLQDEDRIEIVHFVGGGSV